MAQNTSDRLASPSHVPCPNEPCELSNAPCQLSNVPCLNEPCELSNAPVSSPMYPEVAEEEVPVGPACNWNVLATGW